METKKPLTRKAESSSDEEEAKVTTAKVAGLKKGVALEFQHFI